MININKKNYLLEEEKMLADIVKENLKYYGASNKEKIQKENELFHLLCFLYLDNNLKLYNKIIPHEPGDFLIQEKNRNTMIEVVEVFGNDKTYIDIRNRLNNIFKRKIKRKTEGLYCFSFKESINSFNKVFVDKNTNKEYLDNDKYDKKILLIVTGEYDNCPTTGNWIIKFLEEKNFEINKYDYLWVLDYFSSPKDNGPIIIKNTIEEIKEYKKLMKI